MSHITIIIDRVGPIFADPQVRATLEPHTCVKVDAILQKETLSRRDRRCLARALDDWIMHEDGEGDA
jgi:hypothetical protein